MPTDHDVKANILLVDDSPANLLALEAILDDLGHHLIKAPSGEEALRLVLEHDFAVVLLDVRMEGIDGFETARLIRCQERSRRTPIIFLTAHDENRQLVERAYSLGAVDYLVKPFAPVVLRAKVATFLDLFEKTEQLRRMERREFERKLAEENTRSRALAEHSSDAVTLLRADGTVISSSPSSRRVLGYEPSEIVSRSGFEFVHPDDQERVRSLLDGLVRSTGKAVTAEVRARHRDGAWRWVECVGTNLLAEPTVAAIVVNFRDVTERKKSESALRESEERFARFMEHLPGLAWIKDLEGRYVYANAAAEKAFGASRHDLYGKTDDEVFPPETAAAFKENDQRALASDGGIQVTESLRHDDGVVHYSLVSKFPIPDADGNAALVGGMAIDVTEQRRVQANLEESELRFRQLAENITKVFWMSDRDKNEVLYVSPAYESVWGRSCRSLYEQPRSFFDAIHPDDKERVAEQFLRRQARGEAADVEYRVVRPDGAVRWVWDRAFPIRDEAGLVYRLAGIAEDITERKRTEEALREADRKKDEFLAMLAHELRNPLAPIHNAVQVMRLLSSTDPDLKESREMIERQVQQLTRLVDDLLDVSRITRGKIALRTEPVDLAAVIARAVETSRPLIESNRHKLTLALCAEAIRVLADPTRLEQVFANLLNNAAKYTERGGSIWLEVERLGEEVLVRVRDTGFGIPPAALPHVFDLFMQADRTLDRSQGGLGIGLTLVKRLVEMHGGSVTAHSQGSGKGSEFIVRLPILQQEAGRASEERLAPAVVREATAPVLRVLVVDDNKDAADSLAVLLRLWGHEVRIAHDGVSAVKAAGSYRPDVALLDIGLPGLDGYEVARRLRANPSLAGMELIAVTGYGQDTDRRRSREAGFDAHLVKPVDLTELQELLARSAEPRS
jgi:PAS domain S-box-containing protein